MVAKTLFMIPIIRSSRQRKPPLSYFTIPAFWNIILNTSQLTGYDHVGAKNQSKFHFPQKIKVWFLEVFKIRYLHDYLELEKKYFAPSTRRELLISGVFGFDGDD